jgi:SOS-response transcriptional repressor LexA
MVDTMEMGRRLTAARLDRGIKYASEAIRRFGFEKSAYYMHERGERLILPDEALRYAAAYGVSIDYLYGNPKSNNIRVTLAQQPLVIATEDIPMLTSGDIDLLKKIADGGMPKSNVLVPLSRDIKHGKRTYEFVIPDDDLSMAGETGISYLPGSHITVDPDARVLPGNLVHAIVEGFDTPLFRKYVSSKSPGPSAGFKLVALNRDFDDVIVEPGHGLIIGRVIRVSTLV